MFETDWQTDKLMDVSENNGIQRSQNILRRAEPKISASGASNAHRGCHPLRPPKKKARILYFCFSQYPKGFTEGRVGRCRGNEFSVGSLDEADWHLEILEASRGRHHQAGGKRRVLYVHFFFFSFSIIFVSLVKRARDSRRVLNVHFRSFLFFSFFLFSFFFSIDYLCESRLTRN